MVEHGLDKLGYTYVGIDCGWNLRTRAANGDLQPDPKKFPDGILHVAKYVKGLGDGLLKLGIYSEHATADCCGGPRPIVRLRMFFSMRSSLKPREITRLFATGDGSG